jgi:hypothetical protein
MANRSNVTSVEAIESFRASFIVYIAKARAALEEVTSDVGRTRVWVQLNQKSYWEGLAKHRKEQLDEAQEILLSSKMSNIHKVSASEIMAVAKAKRALDEAEAKVRLIKGWARNFENQTQPLARQMEKLHSVLADDALNAVATLTRTLDTLHAYAELLTPGQETASSHASAQKPPDTLATPQAVAAETSADNKGAGA